MGFTTKSCDVRRAGHSPRTHKKSLVSPNVQARQLRRRWTDVGVARATSTRASQGDGAVGNVINSTRLPRLLHVYCSGRRSPRTPDEGRVMRAGQGVRSPRGPRSDTRVGFDTWMVISRKIRARRWLEVHRKEILVSHQDRRHRPYRWPTEVRQSSATVATGSKQHV